MQLSWRHDKAGRGKYKSDELVLLVDHKTQPVGGGPDGGTVPHCNVARTWRPFRSPKVRFSVEWSIVNCAACDDIYFVFHNELLTAPHVQCTARWAAHTPPCGPVLHVESPWRAFRDYFNGLLVHCVVTSIPSMYPVPGCPTWLPRGSWWSCSCCWSRASSRAFLIFSLLSVYTAGNSGRVLRFRVGSYLL